MGEPVRQLVYAFGGFRLDAQRRVLFGVDGRPISLTPRLLDALLYLVERAGRLQTKEELLDALWPNVVVEEHNLNKTISELRRVLGEKPGEHRFIVTQPGRGYRFVADVATGIGPEHVRNGQPPSEGPVSGSTPPLITTRPRRFVTAAGLLGILALAAGLALLGNRVFGPDEPQLRVTSWSAEKGGHQGPIWSPDGSATAFTGRGSANEPAYLYVRELDSSVKRSIARLTAPGIGAPAQWTTAGKILFWDRSGLWSVSPTGGPVDLVRPIEFDTALYGAAAGRVMDVTRDGSVIASIGRTGDGRVGVFTGTLPDGQLTRYEPDPFAMDQLYNLPFLRFSPDGRQLLLWWNAGRGSEEAWLLPFPADASRPPHRIFEGVPVAYGTPEFSWLPDNRHVVLSAGGGLRALYVGDTRSSEYAPLLSSRNSSAHAPVVSPDGHKLVYTDSRLDFDVVTLDLRTLAITPVISSLAWEQMPTWAAQAPSLVYITAPNGRTEIWLHREPQPDRPLVTSAAFETETQVFVAPTLSPDGQRVAYVRIEGPNFKSAHLWMSAVDGGEPERLTNQSVVESTGSWSPDGASYVYFAQEAGGSILKKVRTSGQAEPERLLADPVRLGVPIWSPDGNWILLAGAGILVAADGTAKREIGTGNHTCTFHATESSLYCLRAAPTDGRHALVEIDFDGNVVRTIGSVLPEHRPDSSLHPGIRLSPTPDGSGLTYSIRIGSEPLLLADGLADVDLP